MIRSAPVVKIRAAGSTCPLRLITTLVGSGASPRAILSSRRASDLSNRTGLSARIVPAPTRTASQLARMSSTRSMSASPESRSGLDDASSVYPSSDIAQLSRTYGRSTPVSLRGAGRGAWRSPDSDEPPDRLGLATADARTGGTADCPNLHNSPISDVGPLDHKIISRTRVYGWHTHNDF